LLAFLVQSLQKNREKNKDLATAILVAPKKINFTLYLQWNFPKKFFTYIYHKYQKYYAQYMGAIYFEEGVGFSDIYTKEKILFSGCLESVFPRVMCSNDSYVLNYDTPTK